MMNRYLTIYERVIKEYGIEENDTEAMELLDFLKAQDTVPSKPMFTDIGLEILEYLQNGHEKNNKAKDIAEGMDISSRKISGAMRKLVSDGYIEKFGQNPVIYSLSDQGKNFNIEDYRKTMNEKEGE